MAQLLYGSGDVQHPLPETVRVLDEIVTDFIQGVSFEATRVAHYAGRQKVKLEDFEFAMRNNPVFLGKVQEMFEGRKEIENARKAFVENEEDLARDEAAADAAGGEQPKRRGRPPGNKGAGAGGGGATATAATPSATTPGTSGAKVDEEELGEADDDAEAELDALGKKK